MPMKAVAQNSLPKQRVKKPRANGSLNPLLQALEERRAEMGLSQEKFAVKVLGISYSTYQRWLNKRFNPDMATLARLKALLELTDGSGEAAPALTAEADPVLARLWDNPYDNAVWDNYEPR